MPYRSLTIRLPKIKFQLFLEHSKLFASLIGMQTDKPQINIRKFAKELNSEGWQSCRAFYCRSEKWTGARVRKGQLEISMCNRNWTAVSPLEYFADGSGNRISPPYDLPKSGIVNCPECNQIVSVHFPLHMCRNETYNQ